MEQGLHTSLQAPVLCQAVLVVQVTPKGQGQGHKGEESKGEGERR